MGILDDWKAKKQKAALERTRNPGAGPGHGRLPPGQVETKKWPVLHVGSPPRFEPATWDLRVFGAVEAPLWLGWEELRALPMVEATSDFHCVTRWSRYDNRWRGVSWAEVEGRVRPRPSARFVIFHADGGYTTNIALEDARREGVLLALEHDGAPLAPEHGGPLRAVVPHLYGWKSAKWLRGIELSATDKPGYWETRGYHNRADPWLEQRFSED